MNLIFGTISEWQVALVTDADGKTVVAGFYDSLKRPNLTGAEATVQITDVRGKQVYAALPDNERGWLEMKRKVDAGAHLAVRVAGYVPAGKAWPLRPTDIAPLSHTAWHEPAPGVIRQAIEHYKVPMDNMREDDDFIADWLQHHACTITLADGASLVVQHTAAFTAIDLNTGRLNGVAGIIATLGPAVAAAIQQYQLGGAIVVDAAFLGTGARKGLAEKLQKHLATDPLGAKIISVTKMGLIEITRQRVGPSRCEMPV